MIRGRDKAGLDGDDEDLDVRVITEAEAKKKPQAKKAVPPPKKEVRDEDGDVEMGEVVPEVDGDEDVPPAAAVTASAKKAKTVKPNPASVYGEPCMNPADALESCAQGTVAASSRHSMVY